jgi:hypothetical protein
MSGQLQRLVVEFRTGELHMHALYRRGADGPNLGTKARAREVQELTRTGLQDALEALEDGAECVGTSGFTTREDVLLTMDLTTNSTASEGGLGGHSTRGDGREGIGPNDRA